jgi:hypothetical protein
MRPITRRHESTARLFASFLQNFNAGGRRAVRLPERFQALWELPHVERG